MSIFETLLATAEEYHGLTGRHLQVYGDIGELYGVITHGLKLQRRAQTDGSATTLLRSRRSRRST